MKSEVVFVQLTTIDGRAVALFRWQHETRMHATWTMNQATIEQRIKNVQRWGGCTDEEERALAALAAP